MHRSRLQLIMLDCSPDTMEASVHFWSEALGMPPLPASDDSDPYVLLQGRVGDLLLELQQVNDTSRIHLDIETDNVEAEVTRLEGLGAQREAQIESWWVMRDPSNNLFCVVPIQSRDFYDKAQVWDD